MILLINHSLSQEAKKYYPYIIFFTITSSLFEVLTIGAIMPVITIFIFSQFIPRSVSLFNIKNEKI